MLYGVQFPMSAQALDKEFLIPLGKSKIERTGITLFEKKTLYIFLLIYLITLNKIFITSIIN